jgi:amidase
LTAFDPGYDIVGPTRDQLDEIAARVGFHLSAEELDTYHQLMPATVDTYRRLRKLPEPRPPVSYPRTPGWEPTGEENSLNAWYWRCDIKGAADGPLAGRTVAFKDTVFVAGVPLSAGTAMLEGFIPDTDATVVTRVLDAGGTVAGKAVAENLSLSSSSNSAATGAVLNPRALGHSAGGSSSGCAALVAGGQCDLAVGADQGGSIRMPAALCGIVGLKPTYGLVPFTGVVSTERTLDHLGPMARTVADTALLLGVLAGRDRFDPRQDATPAELPDYVAALSDDARGLRVGVVDEGFTLAGPQAERATALIRDAARALAGIGAKVDDISIPEHADSGAVVTPLYFEGITSQLLYGNGVGSGWRGYYPTALADYIGRVRDGSMDRLPALGKLFVLLGEHLRTRYHGRYYARAQNLAWWLRDAYDRAFAEFDLLLMPTCAPYAVAQPHVEHPTPTEVIAAVFDYPSNTGAFNVTGHPAITVPVGEVDGLPLGLMLVGPHFGDATVLRAAHALEAAVAGRS